MTAHRCATCSGTIITADDLMTINVHGRATAVHRKCPEDGDGGWWCCTGCGSLATLTMLGGMCINCGGVEEDFYRDGEYK